MMKTFKYRFLVLVIIFSSSIYSQKHYNFKLSNITYKPYEETKVSIDFKIENFKPMDMFELNLKVFDKKGKLYNVSTIETYHLKDEDLNSKLDFENIPSPKFINGGYGRVIWDPLDDGYKSIDDNLNFKFTLSKSSNLFIPRTEFILAKSFIFPGWGDIKLARKTSKSPHHLLWGVLGYSAIASSIYFNSEANANYDLYINSYNVEQSDKQFLDAQMQTKFSRLLAGLAALTWTANIAILTKRIGNLKKDINKSKFYNEKQFRVDTTVQKFYVNTKEIYERYYDSALVEYNQKHYGLARAYFEASEAYQKENNSFTKTIDNYISLSTVEIDFKAFYESGLNNLKRFNLVTAKSDLNEAQKLKPTNNKVKLKLDSIDSYNTYYNLAENLYAKKEFEKALDNYKKANRLFNTSLSKVKIDLNKEEIKFIKLFKQGDDYNLAKKYEEAIKKYKLALKIKPNDASIKAKIAQNQKVIDKQNADDKSFTKHVKDGDDFSADDDFDNAIVNYNKALKLKPNDTQVNNKIEKINNYKALIKTGDNYFNKNIFKRALSSYENAQLLFDTYAVKRKINNTKGEMQWDILVEEGDEFVRTKKYEEAIEKYEEAKKIRSTSYLLTKIEKAKKAICDNIVKVANNLKASKKWKEALAKYEEANRLCPSPNIDYQIKIAQQKLKDQKPGEKIVNKKWYEIYNQNGLKVELLFEIKKGLCTNPYAVIYIEYRYTGKVSNMYNNKYLNWSVEYERCDNSKWKFNHAVQVSGDLFKQPTNQNPNYLGSNFITPKKYKIMNESIKAGNDNIYFDVKSVKELSSKYIKDLRK